MLFGNRRHPHESLFDAAGEPPMVGVSADGAVLRPIGALLWRTCKAGEHGDTRMVLLLLCLATAALYAGMHLLQGEIIRRRARGVAQQLATFSLHMFPLSDMPKLLPDCPNMETLRLLLCGNYLRNIQIDPLTAMVYLTAPNLRAYGVVQSFIVCPHCGRRTSVVEGAARQCEHCGMAL